MAGHGVGLEQCHAVDHVLSPARIGSERALPGVTAIEKQNLVIAALGADSLDDRCKTIKSPDAAVRLRERLKILIGQRIGRSRLPRNAETLEKSLPGNVGWFPPRLADAEIDRRLAEIDRHKLPVN